VFSLKQLGYFFGTDRFDFLLYKIGFLGVQFASSPLYI
jgi:hypothetical protein